MTRIWECDKCKKQWRSFHKPDNILNIKIFYKAQSKGGKAVGVDLCDKCAVNMFPILKELRG